VIKADQLSRNYGSIRAVEQVSFEVKRGDVLGFLGPNGAGKSTTMKMLTGFLPPASGAASIDGHDIQQSPLEAKKRLGYLPENGPLYQEMTVVEFLRFAAEIRGLFGSDGRDALAKVIASCHLEQVRNQTIETLSKGYRQRVGMAQALIHNPPYLIMDEPTDGLDPNQKQAVRKLIASMGEEKAIILSTHILEEVQAMCNRIIIIAQGRILVDDTPEGLLQRHPDYNVVKLSLNGNDRAAIRQTIENLDSVQQVSEADDGLLIKPKTGQDLRETLWQAARQQNWSLSHMELVPVRLEEVFRDLTQSDRDD